MLVNETREECVVRVARRKAARIHRQIARLRQIKANYDLTVVVSDTMDKLRKETIKA